MIFLSATEYSETVVDSINTYFNMGWEIEEILNADCGYYFILVSKCNSNYKSATVSDIPAEYKYTLIEEKDNPDSKWFTTSTDNKNAIIEDKYEPGKNWIRASKEDIVCS